MAANQRHEFRRQQCATRLLGAHGSRTDAGPDVRAAARAVDIDGRGGAWSPEITATPQGPSGNGLRLPVSPVLVSNVAQPGASALEWASGSVRYAQRFTTGTADSGYWLEAAGIRFDPQARTIDDFDITAELLLETASGEPGAVIATLATPEVIVPGAVNWFYAPAGTQLEPSNLYYLAVATTDPGDYHQLIQTLSTGEDDSSAAGWSISNSAHSFDASRGAWNQIPGILQVDIRGTQPPAPPAKVSAVLVGGAAVEITYDADLDESSVPSVGAFSVRVDGASRTISGVTVAGRVVTLTLASPITSAQRVTVSYTPPATADAHGIETTGGDAAEGFTDQPVTIPPDPPTITGAESATGGLTVRWDAVADISGYDLEWRPTPRRRGSPPASTSNNTRSATSPTAPLYWVRVRAVKTHEDLDGQTLYTTGWSQSEPAVAGDWTPQNLQVTSGDRMLAVTWVGVAAADGYEVEHRLAPDGDWIRPRLGASPAPPVTRFGLDNGESYEVRVRSVRRLRVGGEDEILRSDWSFAVGSPGLSFIVDDVSSSRVVSGGQTVVRNVRLSDPAGDVLAAVRVGAYVTFGPSAGAVVECLAEPLGRVFETTVTVETVDYALTIDDHRRGACVTDPVGRLTLVYPAAAVSTNSEILRHEFLWLYPDYNGDGARQVLTEPAVRVGEPVRIVRPINYVALGDSYSAGQQGPRDHHSDFEGSYVDEHCARWTLSYPYLLRHGRRLQIDRFGHYSFNAIEAADIDSDGTAERLPGFGFFACTGATTDQLDGAGGQIANLSVVESIAQGVDLVTLTIGGNDLRFADGITTCLLAECAEGRPVLRVGWPPIVGDALDFETLGDRLDDVYEEITDAAGDASVFVLGYPNLVPEQFAPGQGLNICTALDLTSVPREFALNALHALGHWLINAGIIDSRLVDAGVEAVSYVVNLSDQAGRLVINVTQDTATFAVEGVPRVVDTAGRAAAYVARRGSDAISEMRRLEATAVQALIDGSEVVLRYTMEGATLVRGYLGSGLAAGLREREDGVRRGGRACLRFRRVCSR